MKYIAHGISMTGWMQEFETETDEPTKAQAWNEAAARIDDTEARVIENTTRLLNVHPADQRCGYCPVEGSAPEPDPNEGKGDETPQPPAEK